MASVSVTFNIPDDCPWANDPISLITDLADEFYDSIRESEMGRWADEITYTIGAVIPKKKRARS